MTPAQLTDPRSSPGANYVYATDPFGNKRWIQADDVVVTVSPTTKSFLVAGSTWTWVHGLGYMPLVEVYDVSWARFIPESVTHTDVNTLVVTHLFNKTGYLQIR